jgi:hypothetical protein
MAESSEVAIRPDHFDYPLEQEEEGGNGSEPLSNLIEGTDRKEIPNGIDDIDEIRGYGGDDILYGFESDDLLDGGEGNNLV